MANNGYDPEMAIEAIGNGTADLVCFGRPFVANPDLVARLQSDCPRNENNQDKLYGGTKGLTDHPFLPLRDAA